MLPYVCATAVRQIVFVHSGSEEDLFYDAPSSPIGDRPFFPDQPMPLRYADLNTIKRLAKEDPQKNMTNFIMRFEITEVKGDLIKLFEKHYFLFMPDVTI